MSEGDALLKGYSKNIPELILGTGWFLTRDEDNPDGRDHPIPDKPHHRYILNEFCKHKRIVIPKSRQIMISWLMAAYGLARCLTRKHFLAIYQTKREEDAVGFIDRVHFLYTHLPKAVQSARPANLDNSLKIEFEDSDAKFWGIPQGADIVRSNTVSLFLSDEVNFQPNARASLRAAMPSLGKNGQGIWVSSANAGGMMEKLIHATW